MQSDHQMVVSFFFFPCMYIVTDLIGGTWMELKEYFSLNRLFVTMKFHSVLH